MCKRVEEQLRETFGVRHALLTTSCTHALELSVLLLDLKPGDEVITPSFTFVSAANAILLGGGKPVFCEIQEETLTLDPEDVERRITPRTRAIMPMHYAGVGADMNRIMDLARRRGLKVIEDAAQGVNAKYRGAFLGTIGDAGAYSFHDTKNFISGEGGAFVTNDEILARRAEIIREKGTNRSNFLRGEVDKYTWVDRGSSYVLSDILAAVLKFELDELNHIQQRRAAIHARYVSGLRDLEMREQLRLPVIPPYCESNYHIFYLILRDGQTRNNLMRHLKDDFVGASFHYIPLHSAPYALTALGTSGLELPVTDSMASRLLRLPIYPALTDAQVDRVIGKVHEFFA
jgi:dTDP-4-amino-4,6-dideoxygalactose transaminase